MTIIRLSEAKELEKPIIKKSIGDLEKDIK